MPAAPIRLLPPITTSTVVGASEVDEEGVALGDRLGMSEGIMDGPSEGILEDCSLVCEAVGE